MGDVTAALCQDRTYAAQKIPLFDHLVGARGKPRRYFQGECFGGLEVDHEFEFGRLHDRKIGRLLAFEIRAA